MVLLLPGENNIIHILCRVITLCSIVSVIQSRNKRECLCELDCVCECVRECVRGEYESVREGVCEGVCVREIV